VIEFQRVSSSAVVASGLAARTAVATWTASGRLHRGRGSTYAQLVGRSRCLPATGSVVAVVRVAVVGERGRLFEGVWVYSSSRVVGRLASFLRYDLIQNRLLLTAQLAF